MNTKLQTTLLFHTLFIAITGCEQPQLDNCLLPGEEQTPKASQESTETAQTPKICILPEQAAYADMQINASLKDFSPEKEEKMQKALNRLKIVLNSMVFKERVLSHTYDGEETFFNNNGLTNEEIYEVIMLGAETLIPKEDAELDLDITLYYSNNSTVGYTYPDTNRIWVNDKFFSSYTLSKVAANVAHEWTHKLGFVHDYNRTERRNYSVPYAIGTIVQEIIDEM